jgi:hypothetical protein
MRFSRQQSIKLCNVPMTPRTLLKDTARFNDVPAGVMEENDDDDDEDVFLSGPVLPEAQLFDTLCKPSPVKRRLPKSFRLVLSALHLEHSHIQC